MSRRYALLALLLVVLAAVSSTSVSAQDLPTGLVGTVWRLIEFRSSEDEIGVLRPTDSSLYTMSLGENGMVSMRLDCNRASGTWSASTAGASFGFGELRMTRVVCQQPTINVQIARHAEYVSSYMLRDGLLYLNLMADGGTYVWEPVKD